jgi:hypothetical protein
MALLINYRKIRETETEVEYSFGDPEPNRRVVIDKVAGTYSPVDGEDDYICHRVVGKVAMEYGELGRWPGGGGIQS